mmetsp:Transcript_9247/g.23103  ORF Transcript_9247/g.23103 Transcript_9247/m.23103 type:complete len:370 (+) Transcript_9247:121-1230(+)
MRRGVRRPRLSLSVRADLGEEQALAFARAAVGVWPQALDRVEGEGHVRAVLAVLHLVRHEVGVQDPEDALVRDDEDRVPLPLELVDDGVESLHDVEVRLPPRVPVAQLVLLPHRELLGVCLLDFRVRHAVEDARVDLVERVPLPWPHRDPHLARLHRLVLPRRLPVLAAARACGRLVHLDAVVLDEGACLDRPPQCARPQARPRELRQDGRVDKVLESVRVLNPMWREPRVPPDLLREIVLALPVPREEDALRGGVQVHHKRGDPAGEVPEDLVEDDLLPSIHRLDPAILTVLVPQRLVLFPRVLDALMEVLDRALLVQLLVVRHLPPRGLDVVLDDFRVLAHGLDEDDVGARLEDGAEHLDEGLPAHP